MGGEPRTARIIRAEQWHASLLAGTAAALPAAPPPANVRRFVGSSPEMIQPLLEDTLVAVHLGGAKRVRRWCGGRATVHEVRAGSFTLMPAFQANRWLTEGPIDFAHVVLRPSFLERLVIEEFDREPRAVEVVDGVGVEDAFLSALAGALIEEAAADAGPFGRLFRESLFLTYAIALLRRYSTLFSGSGAARPPSGGLVKGGLTPRQLQRAVEFMAEHLARDLSVADLVGTSSLSRAQFFRAFKQSTGKSPYRFLTEMRVERAKRLLERSELPPGAVGAQVGFASTSEFAAAFRRLAGASPRGFRAARR